jgi:hypothetical protein
MAASGPRLTFNTHLHVPPNFSAFSTVEDAVETSAREGVKVIGTSNFHSFGVYDRFDTAAREHGLKALFGLEFISVLDEAMRADMTVNDPANPGRAYICGKGIPDPTEPGAEAIAFMDAARTSNEARTKEMVDRVRQLFDVAGLELDVSYDSIVKLVCERADVPAEWVVLQERHVALGFQEALFAALPADQRGSFLERLYDRPGGAAVDDSVATQGELRARLMKAGCPAFVDETPVPFEDAVGFIRGLGAIVVYPTVADGADPICGYEDPVEDLVERLGSHHIYGAELVTVRNTPECVDRYVKAWREAGIFVTAGTEHNTLERIPVDPTCVNGRPISESSRDIFWEGVCVVAAHQQLKQQGHAGYVDETGALNPGFPDAETRIRYFAEMGAELIYEATGTAREAAGSAR